MLFYVILVLLGAGVSSINATKCTHFDLVVCAFLVDGDKVSKSGLAESGEILDARCRETLPVLKCLNDYAVRCPESDFKHLAVFFQDEYKIQSKICDKNNELRKRYLTHAKCLNAFRDKTQKKCGKLLEFEDAERFTKDQCENYEDNFECSYKEMQRDCGKDALSLLTEVLTPVHKFMKETCKDFQDLHDLSPYKFLFSGGY
ncbi:uncharacterized protein LOC129961569 [Argiope bruennichi]|uniref:DUF19 domain-containing protein n=1 Tax=Argiope bruennichi TaxID=94029 RepID=A0A8T0FUW5_ARGBR|nr:uncharacterized protein LOC129961569 [Argiope bruennichi]KAF8794897.1 hypothetical protein HNY73_002812 [Argiope bruennichi]